MLNVFASPPAEVASPLLMAKLGLALILTGIWMRRRAMRPAVVPKQKKS